MERVVPREATISRTAVALAVLSMAAGGCGGTIDQDTDGLLPGGGSAADSPFGPGGGGSGDGSGTPGSGGAGDPGGVGGSSGDGDSAGTPGDLDFGPEAAAPSARFVRLTHEQWANTVRDLLKLDAADPLPEFRPDPVQGGFLFDNDANSLQVDESLWSSYRRAAGELAALVTSDPGRLAKVLPAGADDPDTGTETIVRELGLRAHRRPLDATEMGEYTTLFEAGAALHPNMAAREAGVRILIEALLQSPHFLYRVETSDQVVDGAIPLNDYEIASRLSYALWHTMPDDALFDAAAAGELSDASTLPDHVQRVLDDARLEGVVADFHAQLLEVEEFLGISPSPTFYPDAPDDLGQLALTEHELFIHDVVFEQEQGYRELLTATHTFVNDQLAGIYGLPGDFTSSFERAELDPAQRRGLFTQIGFLATNSSSASPDPIHRGVFLAERIACLHIAAPDVATPPLGAMPGRTNREVIEEQTEADGTVCASCHKTLINPFGFPFEHYDATGAFRTEDNGFPVDAAASPLIGEGPVMVDGATALIDALAAEPSVHECYARHWLEYLHGRPEAEADEPLIARLGAQSTDPGLAIKQLLLEAVTSPSFLTRSNEELP
ncbi:MAG: DUF1592 domain-containing protein [Myxococcales bacterium]